MDAFRCIFEKFQLNAFETPSLRSALEIAKDNLVESQQKLNTMLTKCSYLEEQAAAKDSYFASREHELKEFHERELERGKHIEISIKYRIWSEFFVILNIFSLYFI